MSYIEKFRFGPRRVEKADAVSINREQPPKKEISFNIGGIVISGYPGTGKSRVIDGLTKRLNIPLDRKLKVGDLFRKDAKKTGEIVLDYYERSEDTDRMADEAQSEIFQNADPKNPFVLESKLGGYLVNSLRGQSLNPSVITVLLTGDKDVLRNRVYHRERKKHPGLTLEESTEKTERRQSKDLEQWKKVHPELNFDPLASESAFIYDIVVDTTNFSAKEVEEEIYKQLLSLKAITEPQEINDIDHQAPGTSGVIFEAN